MTRIFKPDYLEQAVYNVLDAISTETIVYGNQQQVEVTPPYSLLTLDTRRKLGEDTMFMTTDDGTHIYHGDRNGGITLLVVGDLCGERADDIVNALQRPTASAAFRQYGPVLHSATPITLGPIMTEGEQVEQAVAIDIQFRVKVVHFEAGGFIETIAIRYTGDRGDGTDYRGALVVSKPGTTPPAGEVLEVVIDPPDYPLVAGTDTTKLPTTHVAPFENMESFSASTSDTTIAEVIRPSTGNHFLRLYKAGTVDYTLTVQDKAGKTISDTVTLQIID